MTSEQIAHMVQRFLAWKLPKDFRPDGGITFNAVGNLGTEHQYRREPMGTNLFDARQAEAMVRYIVAGIPAARAEARPAPVVDREAVARAICDLREIKAAVFGSAPGDEPDVYADYDRLCELERKMEAAINVALLSPATSPGEAHQP